MGRMEQRAWLVGAVRTLQKRVEWLEASMLLDLHLSWSTSYKHQQDTPHTHLSWSTFHQNHRCMLYMPRQILQCMSQKLLWWSTSLRRQWHATPLRLLHQLLAWNTFLHPTVYVAPAPVVEYISPDPTVYVAPAPVVEYISPDPAEYAVAQYITPSPMEFVEAALHEIDEEFCRDDFEALVETRLAWLLMSSR